MKQISFSEEDYFVALSEINKEFMQEYYEPHQSQNVSLLLCKQGTMHLLVNLREFTVTAKDLLAVTPYDIVQIKGCSEDAVFYVVSYHFQFIQDLYLEEKLATIYEHMTQIPLLHLNGEEYGILLDYYSFLTQIYRKIKQQYPSIIKYQLVSFLYGIHEIYKKKGIQSGVTGNSRTQQLYFAFLRMVMAHHAQQHQLAFYADKLCISVKYLMWVVKTSCKRNAKSIINEAVIMNAKIRLDSTDETAQQISEQLGFPNASFFGKFFKKQVGCTPKQYRDRKLNKTTVNLNQL